MLSKVPSLSHNTIEEGDIGKTKKRKRRRTGLCDYFFWFVLFMRQAKKALYSLLFTLFYLCCDYNPLIGMRRRKSLQEYGFTPLPLDLDSNLTQFRKYV